MLTALDLLGLTVAIALGTALGRLLTTAIAQQLNPFRNRECDYFPWTRAPMKPLTPSEAPDVAKG